MAPVGVAGEPAPPAPGANLVELADGRVHLALREASPLAVLEVLGARAGFALAVGDVRAEPVTMRLDDASLAEALAALLRGIPYGIDYVLDPTTGAHRVGAVRVGTFREPQIVGVAQPPGAGETTDATDRATRAEALRRRLERERQERRVAQVERAAARTRDPEETGALLGRFLATARERSQASLDDPDPEVRAEAVAAMDVEGSELDRLIETARSDPDPSVRAAAAERLGDEGTHRAVAGLLDTLGDSDPSVLLAAIQAVESAGDESLVARLEPLTHHPDPQVRAAAGEAIASLE